MCKVISSFLQFSNFNLSKSRNNTQYFLNYILALLLTVNTILMLIMIGCCERHEDILKDQRKGYKTLTENTDLNSSINAWIN